MKKSVVINHDERINKNKESLTWKILLLGSAKITNSRKVSNRLMTLLRKSNVKLSILLNN